MEQERYEPTIKSEEPELPKPNWKFSETRKERILYELERKMNVLTELQSIIMDITQQESAEELKRKFTRFFQDVSKQFPEAARRVKVAIPLREELIRLDELPPQSETEKMDWAKIASRKASIYKQREKLFAHPDARFLGHLHEGLESLRNKREYIEQNFSNTEQFFNDLETRLFPQHDQKIDRQKVKELIIEPFGVTFIFDREYFQTVMPESQNVAGRHLVGYPFSIAPFNDNHAAMQSMYIHESIHNVLDGFLTERDYPYSYLKDLFAAVHNEQQSEAFRKEAREALISLKARDLIDMLHEEMLADIDDVERLLFSPYHASHQGFSTANNQSEKLYAILREEYKKAEDDDIKDACERLARDIVVAFVGASHNMRTALFFSTKLEEPFGVHALLTILPPSKFYRIQTYIESQLGKELYGGYKAFYNHFVLEDLTLSQMEKILSICDQLQEHEKAMLVHSLQETANQNKNLDMPNIRNIEVLHAHRAKFNELSNYLGLHREDNDKIMKPIVSKFLLDQFFIYRRKNFVDLPIMVEQLLPEEKGLVGEAIREYFSGAFQRYEKLNYGGDPTDEYIKSLSLWKVLEEFKLDSYAQEGLAIYARDATTRPE